MTERKKVYPDWVQQYRVRGTTVKKRGNNYYLYKHTSKRVPGKKYPMPVDTYIGVITKDGVIKAEKKMVPIASECDVYEYGFSSALQMACPEEWKNAVGNDWEDILFILIKKVSQNTYLIHDNKIPDENGYRVSLSAQYSSLMKKIKSLYKVDKNELEQLKYIYIVYYDKMRILSRISEEQRKILDKLGISNLEVY